MKTKEKIIVWAVVLLLAITFLPMQGAYAGVTDYIRNKVNSATSYVTNSSTYKSYVSPAVNRISSNSAVSALTRGLGSIPGGVRTSLVSGNIALTKGLATTSNTIGKYTGLWGAKEQPRFNGAFVGMIKTETTFYKSSSNSTILNDMLGLTESESNAKPQKTENSVNQSGNQTNLSENMSGKNHLPYFSTDEFCKLPRKQYANPYSDPRGWGYCEDFDRKNVVNVSPGIAGRAWNYLASFYTQKSVANSKNDPNLSGAPSPFGTPYRMEYREYNNVTINPSSMNKSNGSNQTNSSDLIGELFGLNNSAKPQGSNIVKVNNKNAATIMTRSRVEYSVTDKRTNKTIPINESVFRSLVDNAPQKTNIEKVGSVSGTSMDYVDRIYTEKILLNSKSVSNLKDEKFRVAGDYTVVPKIDPKRVPVRNVNTSVMDNLLKDYQR